MATSPRIGSQVWLERNDTPQRVDRLFDAAARAGIGHARIFLMWPWIEPRPGEWDFGLFDAAFAAAARTGIKIKATLTANSGPWHIGTPMMLHSHTGILAEAQRAPMREYIRRCVTRYAAHPALGQWILWNEPLESLSRGDAALAFWRAWLRNRYADVSRLNARWLTGFRSFDEIPFPENIPHPLHARSHWLSYGPALDDQRCRAAWLNEQLRWVRDIVREAAPRSSPQTPLCVNPAFNLGNLAAAGTDLPAMAELVDTLGASFHPAWSFTYADRADYPALIATGVRQMVSLPGRHTVEVTEVQTGNTTESSIRPNDVTPGEIARFHLAGLAAGATSVTGWCFNARRQDNEAGDWALLDDADNDSPRSLMLRRVADRLAAVEALTGPWQPAPAEAVVCSEPASHGIELIAGKDTYMVQPGRRSSDGPQAASLLAARVMRLGAVATIATIAGAAALAQRDVLLIASHVTSWSATDAAALLTRVAEGAVLLVDGMSGRRDPDATLHDPWPGGLALPLELEAAGLETDSRGHPVLVAGQPAGVSPLTRAVLRKLSPAWSAWPDVRFADGEPAVLERSWGQGRVVFYRGALGAALLTDPPCGFVEVLLGRVLPPAERRLRPVGGSPHAVCIPVRTGRGRLAVLLCPDATERGGKPVRLKADIADGWTDLWTQTPIGSTPERELLLPAPEGVAILWRP